MLDGVGTGWVWLEVIGGRAFSTFPAAGRPKTVTRLVCGLSNTDGELVPENDGPALLGRGNGGRGARGRAGEELTTGIGTMGSISFGKVGSETGQVVIEGLGRSVDGDDCPLKARVVSLQFLLGPIATLSEYPGGLTSFPEWREDSGNRVMPVGAAELGMAVGEAMGTWERGGRRSLALGLGRPEPEGLEFGVV